MQRRRPSSTRRSRSSRRNAIRSLRRNDTIGVLLLGAARVGKTALLQRWMNGIYQDKYKPTVEDFHTKSVTYMDETATVGIIDMAGSRDFPAMIDLYLSRADSVMLFYDLGDATTLRELSYLYEKVKLVREERMDMYVTLVATKTDKYEDMDTQDVTSLSKIESMMKELGDKCLHVKTSAKSDLNVSEAFDGVLKRLVPTMKPTGDNLKRLELISKQRVGNHHTKRCSIM